MSRRAFDPHEGAVEAMAAFKLGGVGAWVLFPQKSGTTRKWYSKFVELVPKKHNKHIKT